MKCPKCKGCDGKYRRGGRTVPCPRCRPKPSPEAVNVRGRWFIPAPVEPDDGMTDDRFLAALASSERGA